MTMYVCILHVLFPLLSSFNISMHLFCHYLCLIGNDTVTLKVQTEGTWGFCTATKTTSFTVSVSTVIDSRILCSQTIHLQIQLLIAVVSGDGKPTSDWLRVVCSPTTIMDTSNPVLFQEPVWSGHSVGTECKSRSCTNQFVELSWSFNYWFRFSQQTPVKQHN